jgi:hypothetical protein
MGADIYLKSKFDKNFDNVQKEIDEAETLYKVTAQHSIIDVANGEESPYDTIIIPLLEKQHSVGYFRDAYNSYSLLGNLGMSWTHEVYERLDDKSMLSVENCKWLLEEINNRRIGEEVTKEPIVARLHSMFGDVSSTVELDAEKIEHLVKKKSKLANLLQDAIELKESLYCSI